MPPPPVAAAGGGAAVTVTTKAFWSLVTLISAALIGNTALHAHYGVQLFDGPSSWKTFVAPAYYVRPKVELNKAPSLVTDENGHASTNISVTLCSQKNVTEEFARPPFISLVMQDGEAEFKVWNSYIANITYQYKDPKAIRPPVDLPEVGNQTDHASEIEPDQSSLVGDILSFLPATVHEHRFFRLFIAIVELLSKITLYLLEGWFYLLVAVLPDWMPVAEAAWHHSSAACKFCMPGKVNASDTEQIKSFDSQLHEQQLQNQTATETISVLNKRIATLQQDCEERSRKAKDEAAAKALQDKRVEELGTELQQIRQEAQGSKDEIGKLQAAVGASKRDREDDLKKAKHDFDMKESQWSNEVTKKLGKSDEEWSAKFAAKEKGMKEHWAEELKKKEEETDAKWSEKMRLKKVETEQLRSFLETKLHVSEESASKAKQDSERLSNFHDETVKELKGKADSTEARLRKEVEDEKAASKGLQESLKKLRTEKRGLQQEAQGKGRESAAKAKEVQELQKQLANAKADASRTQDEFGQVQHQLVQAKTSLQTTEEELQQARESYKQQDAQYDVATTKFIDKYKNFEADIERFNGNVNESTKKCQGLEDEVARLQAALASAQQMAAEKGKDDPVGSQAAEQGVIGLQTLNTERALLGQREQELKENIRLSQLAIAQRSARQTPPGASSSKRVGPPMLPSTPDLDVGRDHYPSGYRPQTRASRRASAAPPQSRSEEDASTAGTSAGPASPLGSPTAATMRGFEEGPGGNPYLQKKPIITGLAAQVPRGPQADRTKRLTAEGTPKEYPILPQHQVYQAVQRQQQQQVGGEDSPAEQQTTGQFPVQVEGAYQEEAIQEPEPPTEPVTIVQEPQSPMMPRNTTAERQPVEEPARAQVQPAVPATTAGPSHQGGETPRGGRGRGQGQGRGGPSGGNRGRDRYGRTAEEKRKTDINFHDQMLRIGNEQQKAEAKGFLGNLGLDIDRNKRPPGSSY